MEDLTLEHGDPSSDSTIYRSDGDEFLDDFKQHLPHFFHVRDGDYLIQKKTARLKGGGQAVGMTGVCSNVGVYFELGDEYLCWHMDDPSISDNDVVGTKMYNDVRDSQVRNIRRLLGHTALDDEARRSLIVMTGKVTSGAKSIIEGVLTWAGVEDHDDWKHTSGRYREEKEGFIVKEPGNLDSVEWSQRGPSMETWAKTWNAKRAGRFDGKGSIVSRSLPPE